jgi:glyoxylase-like metal-dependent hydrolase (beta-lactamase superfamily II)
MALQIQSFQFNAFQENTFIVWDQKKNCVIIDPGCYSRQEQHELLDFIEENELKPIALLNTHAHIDHVLGNAFVKKTFEVDYYLHPSDLTTLKSVASYAHLYGFEGYEVSPEPNKFLEQNQLLLLDEIEIQVFFTPGHSPGHVVFYFPKGNFVVNGDVLFQGSFGRVDLPGGDLEILKKSIFETMFMLPDETVVYCGHGSETTIGHEKQFNYIHQF